MHNDKYGKLFTDALQLVYGRGFLSAFNQTELKTLLNLHDVSGKSVLDIGSGMGAIDMLLVSDHGAGNVIGLDINQRLTSESSILAAEYGVEDKISFLTVLPGAIPLPDESFDIILTVDLIPHLDDLDLFYREAMRILKPGGSILSSEWLWISDPRESKNAELLSKSIPIIFAAPMMNNLRSILAISGFTDIVLEKSIERMNSNDREIALLEGPLMYEMINLVGPTISLSRLLAAKTRRSSIESGELIPMHIKATKAGP